MFKWHINGCRLHARRGHQTAGLPLWCIQCLVWHPSFPLRSSPDCTFVPSIWTLQLLEQKSSVCHLFQHPSTVIHRERILFFFFSCLHTPLVQCVCPITLGFFRHVLLGTEETNIIIGLLFQDGDDGYKSKHCKHAHSWFCLCLCHIQSDILCPKGY